MTVNAVTETLPEDVQEMMARTRKNPISVFLEMYMQIFKFFFVTSVRIGNIEVKGLPHRTKKVAKMDCFVKGIKILCDQFSVEIAKSSRDLEFKQESTFFELLRKHTYSKFYKFLYAQTMLYAKNPAKSIFVKNAKSGKLALRKGLSFHMFVNTAPCGDARVYTLNDTTLVNANEAETNSLLRFKIYLSSVSVADKADQKRMERALYGRLDGFKPPAPFHLNKHYIGRCQDDGNSREATAGSPISVNWNLADDSVEVLRTTYGRIEATEAKEVSRLSKKEMSVLFKKVCDCLGLPVPEGFTYENLKVHCKDYQQGKLALESWLRENKLGMWQSKPDEVSMFTV
ncbi:hypothetical protein ANCCEY_04873 [Ancylostoma ceylanicum]|uniref:A to I editase domain-containing protein n=1 Tax=Ancylostoma ceylanicum TaxID=53326 RepID=A0A0D6M826_9BILA|nr:hypothetical protein ANCCEY_04873 [Ancylostoma ceylanicum]